MPQLREAAHPALPEDAAARHAWPAGSGGRRAGPSVVAIRDGAVLDISRHFPTMRDLCEAPDPAAALRAADGENLGSVDDILANTPPDTRDPAKAPCCSPRSTCRR